MGYADNLLVLSPSRDGTQKLVDLASEYAREYLISFSTNPNPSKSKMKAIYFQSSKTIFPPKNIMLNGDRPPWVDQAKHLGNTVDKTTTASDVT